MRDTDHMILNTRAQRVILQLEDRDDQHIMVHSISACVPFSLNSIVREHIQHIGSHTNTMQVISKNVAYAIDYV